MCECYAKLKGPGSRHARFAFITKEIRIHVFALVRIYSFGYAYMFGNDDARATIWKLDFLVDEINQSNLHVYVVELQR